MSYRKTLLLLILHFAFCILHSQTLKVPYQFGFEEGDPEMRNWTTSNGNCVDKWVIGSAEFNEGAQSLYISNDGGKTAKYDTLPNIVVISREFELSKGNYDISFDWKNAGYEGTSELYAFTFSELEAEEYLKSNEEMGYLPKSLLRSIRPIATSEGEYLAMSDRKTWINGSFSINVAGVRKIYLAFMWVNSNQDPTIANPMGACIDNIQITSAMCPKPENLKAETSCGEIKFYWDGVAPIYQCGYKPLGSKHWIPMEDIDGAVENPSCLFENMPEGAYDLRVRAISDEDTSAYVYLNSVVVWCPENHCFDYVSLDNKEQVLCEVGSLPAKDPATGITPPVSFGESKPSPSVGGNDVNARHIACWVQGMYDPNTGNRLSIIPEGALASIRLGNENAGAQAERITYTFDVVDDLVLLMRYAVVLQQPGHNEDNGIVNPTPDNTIDPYFGFEILKEDDTPIDPSSTCGQASFSPDDPGANWETYTPSPGLNIVWKDWTTIGVDLRPYKGQKIKIRLRSQDCRNSKHFGYGYFTLDCVDATIKSEGCEKVILEAPSGFDYEWSNNLGENIENKTSQKVTVDAIDGVVYFCDVKYKHDPNCGFVLSSAVTKQFPKPEFDYSWTPSNCQNYITFENKSYVYSVDSEGKIATIEGKSPAKYEWEFEFNGEVEIKNVINPKYPIPNEGGKLKVRLMAQLEDDACRDIYEEVIDVKPIHGHDTIVDKRICFGSSENFGDQLYYSSGTYVDTMPNIWGCDSIVTLNLYVRPKIDDVIVYDTICGGDECVIGNSRFNTTGVYEVLLKTNDDLQCDSVVVVHLLVVEPLELSLSQSSDYVCAEKEGLSLSVSYQLNGNSGHPYYYSVVFDDVAHKAGFNDIVDGMIDTITQNIDIEIPDSCRPNHYTATINFRDSTSYCKELSLPIEFDVYYSASILQSKFDNLITVYDSAYNGGYVFDAYQWYENGEKLEGATNSFYILAEGEQFEAGDCYYLEVKRKDDGVIMRTCEICPAGGTPVVNVYSEDPYVVPTVLKSKQPMRIENLEKGEVNIFTLSGQQVSTYTIDSEIGVDICAPSESGVYLVQVVTAMETFITKIIITK